MNKPFSLELTASILSNIIKNSTGLKVVEKTQSPEWDLDSEQILITIFTPKKTIPLGRFTIVESKATSRQSLQSNFTGILTEEAMSEVVEEITKTIAQHNQINESLK